MSGELTRLDIIVNVRFPGRRAHGIQLAAMAEALANTGLNVDVVVPRRFPYAHVDPWEHYGVRRNFAVYRMANLDTIDMLPAHKQRLPFLLQSVTFGLRALARAAMERDAGILVRDHYTTEILVGGMRDRDRARIAAEIHNLPLARPRMDRLARSLRKLQAVITISDGLKKDLVREGLDPDRILVARDGVHLSRFETLPDRRTARTHLGIHPETPTVVYAGQLYEWKGVDTLIEAIGKLPSTQLLVVGGDKTTLPRMDGLISRFAPGQVILTGPVPHQRVPFYLAAADVISLPNSARELISERYTSPLKLFEAMAVGRPVVASDIPSLREVLEPDETALMVPPDDAEALARGIETLLSDEALGERLAAGALDDVKQYDWSARGERVAHFLRDHLRVGHGA
jgi:glycosyltransferase involved in cell wall biosynthesis